MPRKFSNVDKQKWLELYEKGKSESWIANQRKIDLRTVKRGIQEAMQARTGLMARVELVRDALRKHQELLLDTLSKMQEALKPPAIDLEVLSWYRGDNSVFYEPNLAKSRLENEGIKRVSTISKSLRQHLKGNRLWRLISQWDKAYLEHLLTRADLQYKVISLIQEKTGIIIVDKDISRPFIYSYTTCYLFYKALLHSALGGKSEAEFLAGITADTQNHRVMSGTGTILAEVTSDADGCRSSLVEAYKEIRKTTEFDKVVTAYRLLEKLAPTVDEAVERIMLLGILPGSCDICQRIGM
jgi:hypothetical protein